MKNKFLLAFGILTAVLIAVSFLLGSPKGYFTFYPIFIGTLIIASITLLSYFLSVRNVNHSNPHKFVGSVMSSTMIKFFLMIIAGGAYIYLNKKALHKPDLFYLMFTYMLYAVTEALYLSRLARTTKPD